MKSKFIMETDGYLSEKEKQVLDTLLDYAEKNDKTKKSFPKYL